MKPSISSRVSPTARLRVLSAPRAGRRKSQWKARMRGRRNCREVRGLWEAEEFLRERERGFDYPYASQFQTVTDVQSNQ